jgi:NodT family efflux transporter outer membrane factor (OMF) lipoprotein
MTQFRAAILLPVLLLGACSSLNTPYTRPALPDAPKWRSENSPATPTPTDWWQALGDPQLTHLVAAVLDRNSDLLAATLRARRALLQAESVGVSRIPSLNGSANAERRTNLGDGTSTNTYTLSLGATYELDLWGRLSSAQDIAALQAAASAEDVEAARMTVVAATIETYWRLGFASEDIAAARAGLEAARKVEALAVEQEAGGAATALEIAEARQAVESQAAQISDMEQNRVVLRNTLLVLLNGAPSPVPEPKRLPARKPAQLSAGLPAELLARRPDLRAAELRLRASLRTVDNTRASLYPQLSLTGNLGTSSSQLLNILANPAGTLGAGLVLPFLNLRDGELRVKVSQAEYELAATEFRAALLTAFSDTSTALSASTTFGEKSRRLRAALTAAQAADRLTEERYRAGALSLRAWLDAEDRTRAARRALAATRLEQLLNEVQIFRVLGGAPAHTPAPAPALAASR